MMSNEWTSAEHALKYLSRAENIPYRVDCEAMLMGEISCSAHRVLDLGTGDGRAILLNKLRT